MACPIPPSLVASPILSSPIFEQHSYPLPRLPSEEDELWLQDTIPISSTSTGASGSLLHNLADDDGPSPPSLKLSSPARHSPPLSPPIIQQHHQLAHSPHSPPYPAHHPSQFTYHRHPCHPPCYSPLAGSPPVHSGAAPMQYPFPRGSSYATQSRPPSWTLLARTRSTDSSGCTASPHSEFAARVARESFDIQLADPVRRSRMRTNLSPAPTPLR